MKGVRETITQILDDFGVVWFQVHRGDGRPVYWTMDINDAYSKLAVVRVKGNSRVR